MKVIKGDPALQVKTQTPGACVMIGYLDGVHVGHQMLAQKVIELAKEKNGYPSAFTFNGKLYTKNIPSRGMLTTSHEKIELLEELGIDTVFLADFTDWLRDMADEDFVRIILKDNIKASAVAVGPSFTFGKGGKAGAKELKNLCLKNGIDCTIIPQVTIGDEPVSSSRIRNYLYASNILEANVLLGRRYFLTGTIISGAMVGRSLGFPTANLDVSNPLKLIPGGGVYACFGHLEGVKYECAVSIGNRPTFLGGDNSLEAHILDYSGLIYGRELKLEFVAKIRDQIQFESKEKLSLQISKDVIKIREILEGQHE